MKVDPLRAEDSLILTWVEGNSSLLAKVRVDRGLGLRVTRLAFDIDALVGRRGKEFVIVLVLA